MKRKWKRLFTSIVAMVLVVIMVNANIMPAFTAEKKIVCNVEEHTHTENCYDVPDPVLTCGLEEEGHVHEEACYTAEEAVLSCGKEVHVHGDDCYTEVIVDDENTEAGTEASVTTEAASTEVSATTEAASTEAPATTEAASTEAAATTEAASTEVSATTEAASTEATVITEVASTETGVTEVVEREYFAEGESDGTAPEPTEIEKLEEMIKEIPSVDQIRGSYIYKYGDSATYQAYKNKKETAIQNAKDALDIINALENDDKTKFDQLDEQNSYTKKLNALVALEDEKNWGYDMSKTMKLNIPGDEVDDSYSYQYSSNCYYSGSMHMSSDESGDDANIVTFLLVDTSKYNNDTNPWKPNTKTYSSGSSNYEVAYCCDYEISSVSGHPYKRINLEDSTYYSAEEASHIRAIAQNSYPFISAESMTENLIKNGAITAEEANNLDNSQLMTAAQMAIWHFANGYDFKYNSSYGVKYKSWYSNELNADVEFNLNTDEIETNINKIYSYLIGLSPVTRSKIVISDVSYEAYKTGTDKFDVTVKVILNADITAADDLTITVSVDGTDNIVETKPTSGGEITVKLSDVEPGKQINVEVSGTQELPKGVYFYEPWNDPESSETERTASQSFVGVSSGTTAVHAATSFNLDDINTSLSLQKYAIVDGEKTSIPVEGAIFALYRRTKNEDGTYKDVKLYELVTDKEGKIVVEALELKENQSYYFREVKAAPGYEIPEDSKEIDLIKGRDGTLTGTAYNSGSTDLTLHKANETKTTGLSGAQFALKYVKPDGTTIAIKNGDSTLFTTDAKGNIVFENLIPGDYILTEIKAPEGYVMNEGEKETKFTIKADSKGTNIALANEKANVSLEGTVLTLTNATATGSGKITVTKEIGYLDTETMEAVDLIAKDATYYVGIFKDAKGEQPYGTDHVRKIRIQRASSGTATFEKLPVGTYYIFETDEKGKAIPVNESQNIGNVMWQCQVAEGSSQKVEFVADMVTPEGYVGLYNLYFTMPDGFSMKGEIEISKKVLVDGVETTTDEKFYAGIFVNETDTKPIQVVELVQGGSVKTEVALGGENGDQPVTYYVYETDADGNRVGEAFVYEVTGEGAVNVDKANSLGKVELVNAKTTKETTEEETETEEKTTKSSKTGDESQVMLYLILAIAALASVVVVLFIRRRRA